MERKSASIFSNCPWEVGSESVIQPFGKRTRPEGPYNKAQQIQPPKGNNAVTVFEETRDGLPKAYMPNFFYRAPFGYPRYKDLNYYRQLAASIYVDMCVTAIIDEVCSVEWEIVAEDRAGNEVPGKESDVERIQEFFYNPNTNKESWEMIVRMMLPDLLELNSGIMVKIFNMFGEMVEICSRDGMAFTKNPDPYGFYTSRADLILMKNILGEGEEQTQQMDYPAIQMEMDAVDAQNEGAYFQYGFNTGARPIPFGRREIVWFEKKVRTDNLYGRSSMEVLAKTVQTLIYAVESQLEYFNDNSIPPGVLGMDGMSAEDLKAFGQQWIQQQKVQDSLGNWKRANHKLPMVNKMPKFERLGFTNQELELIESQKWWSKLVWGAFGITATELGFTEDAKGSANQIVQTSVAKKRIIYPLLRLIEYHVNTEIIPEFGVEGIRYKYKIFDIDEETKKWGLYKMQTESDLKTVNEIRNSEGLDELEGGDETGSMRADRQQTEDRQAFSGEPLQQEADAINQDSQNTRDHMTGKKNIDSFLYIPSIKYRYVKRTGAPGHYIYWYKNPKTGKLTAGDKLEKPKRSKEYNDAVEDAKEQIFRYNSTANEAVVAMEENNPSLTKEELMEIALDVENYEKENFEKMTPLEMFNSYKPESKAQTTESGLTLQPNEEKAFLKFKYAKRTGAPGKYIYWYKNPKTGKYFQGPKPKEHKPKEDTPDRSDSTADKLPKIDPYKKGKKMLEDTGEDYDEWKLNYANPDKYKKKTFYHWSTQEDMTAEKLLAGKGKGQTELTEDGLYVGRDSSALERFYGLTNEMEGTKGKLIKFEGEPTFMDLTKDETDQDILKETLKIAKKKYPKSKQPMTDYVLGEGYDGMRYFDPVATGEEFILYNTKPFQDKNETKAMTTDSGLTLQPNEEKAFLKFKYAKRTGSPGNYIYWYWNPKKLRLEPGKDPGKKPQRESDDDNSPFKEGEKEYQGEDGKKNLSHERFNLDKAKLLSDNGYGRTVYELSDGKVIKIARNLNGLQQNDLEGDKKNKLLPEVYERGKDYVVVENVKRDDAKSKELLKPLNKFGMSDFDRDKPQELKDEFNKLDKKYPGAGFKEALKYNMWSEDFLNPENWGWKDGRPYHIDAGTFDVTLLGQDEDDLEPKYGSKWKEIQQQRKKGKKKGDKVITGGDTKAMTTNSPLTLGPNEEMGPGEKKLKKEITDLLKSNKEKVFELLDAQGKPEPLMQIKSIDDLPGLIKKIFSIFTFKKIVDEVIKFEFNFGWDKSEKQIDQNVPMNNKAVEFLQEHTFDNIKDMTEEISNDLKAELSRGIINGEGLAKLKKRVDKVFDVGNNRAEMIARTETNRAENNGKLLAMKNSGIKMKKQWLAAIDPRTSELCKHLDGQTVELDDNFKHGEWSGQSPPSHVNCRSTMIFIEDTEE